MYCVRLFRFGSHSFLFFLAGILFIPFSQASILHCAGTLYVRCRNPRTKIPGRQVLSDSTVGKPGLKLNIQKMKIMASGPITSWQIDGETKETVTDFIWGGSKITADGDCSHEIKRQLLLGRKVKTQHRQHIKKQRPTKVRLVKAMVYPVVMYGCIELDYKES